MPLYPENLPSGTTPTISGGFGEATFIPTGGNPSLATDLIIQESAGVWVGYLETPPAFSKTASSGLVNFPENSDVGTISLSSDTIINHDIVITYKLTDVGSDATVLDLPSGGTTLQVAIVNETGSIYQNPSTDPPQVDIFTLRKFNNGIHDTIILKGRILHSNSDTIRIKFWAVNGNVAAGARINCFSVNWQLRIL
jgi:hypothetical protein